MELKFKIEHSTGTKGTNPDFLHFENNEISILFVYQGEIYAKSSKTDEENYSNPFSENTIALKTKEVDFFKIDPLGGFGAIGAIRCQGTNYLQHKLLIYEYKHDMSSHLASADIGRTIGNPITTFGMSLLNSKKKGRYLLSERKKTSLKLNPGAKIVLNFLLGNSGKVNLGEFYVDRSDFKVNGLDIKLSGRNILGKSLKDQSFDEKFDFEYDFVHNIIKKIIIELGGVEKDKVFVEESDESASYTFESQMNLMSGINEIFKTLNNWHIEENNGRIIVGSAKFGAFNPRKTFYLRRNKDAFSRQIIQDDAESYRRICIKDKEKTFEIYKEVEVYEGWNLKTNRTLHLEVPEGVSEEKAERYATNIANLLGKIGKIEVFDIKFNPEIEPGDEVVIKGFEDSYSEELGLITSIKHKFGKDGIFTTINVDSGGTKTTGRLSDYIKNITTVQEWSKYSDKKKTPEPGPTPPGGSEGNPGA